MLTFSAQVRVGLCRAVLLGVVSVAPAYGAWPSNPLVNLPVCTASGNQASPSITTDGAGGAIIVWPDGRGVSNDIYARRVLATGEPDPQWPADGLAICVAANSQLNPTMVSDLCGGALIAWQDFRAGATSDIYAHHVSSNGLVDPLLPAAGQPVCVAGGNQQSPVSVGDGSGGMLVVWQDFRAGATSDVYSHHILASGVVDPLWPVNGQTICAAGGNQQRPVLASDGAGGALVAWQDFRSDTTADIYAQHITSNGTLDPLWPVNGLVICSATGSQLRPAIVSDGSGGALLGWDDLRGGTTANIFAHHVLPAGSVDASWPTNGLLVCGAANNQIVVSMVTDGDGGAIFGWQDYRNAAAFSDVFAQHILGSGIADPSWPTDGQAVCTVVEDQVNIALATDGQGGALITWNDRRLGSGKDDIYVHHLPRSGVLDPLWPIDGQGICKAARSQQVPKLIADGSGGAIVTWQDGRPTTGTNDIYAQRVQADGQLGGDVVGVAPRPATSLTLRLVCPNPVRSGRLRVACTLAGGPAAQLQLLDTAGRSVGVGEQRLRGAGYQEVDLVPSGRIRPGIYFVRLRQGAAVQSLRVVVYE